MIFLLSPSRCQHYIAWRRSEMMSSSSFISTRAGSIRLTTPESMSLDKVEMRRRSRKKLANKPLKSIPGAESNTKVGIEGAKTLDKKADELVGKATGSSKKGGANKRR
ncbi:hypothetical protein EYC84_011906 [Monilinia fructicola]|uniref:Uncharacterized protein n=1 Tax=Monilinia fructicola TaxID=38448 RepID=A0A5M9J9F7_MONFR|nr:hypothetical protein EYC84_011906 [Monilinia fructicola]